MYCAYSYVLNISDTKVTAEKCLRLYINVFIFII
jgi:hypothetical protein